MKDTQLSHIVVTSADSLQYYPMNKPGKFVSQLARPLPLCGQWYAGLKELFVPSSGVKRGSFVIIDVYLSEANGAIIGGCESSLLKRVIAKVGSGGIIHFKINPTELTGLKPGALTHLSLYFNPVFPSELSFDQDTPSCATVLVTNSPNVRV